ncbi:hypothetical protein BH23ACT6_BH23ACT6_06530 [soil metagenome]
MPPVVTVKSWEALYFDHNPEHVFALVDAAAAIGAERFVLDDGWFTGRRDDSRGLGDWQVDRTVWPDGLEPLVSGCADTGCRWASGWRVVCLRRGAGRPRRAGAHPASVAQ